MRREVHGIVADANCADHLALLRLFQQNWRQEVWEFLRLAQVSFSDLGLPPDASDREVWEVCHQNTPQSLPVFTLADDQRVLRDRQYAETVADRLIAALFDIDRYRGTGRLYLP
jgi:hypothetical protein